MEVIWYGNKREKIYKQAEELVDRTKLYDAKEAIEVIVNMP